VKIIVQDDAGQVVHTWQGIAASVIDGLRRAEQTWQVRREEEMINLFGRTTPPGHVQSRQFWDEGGSVT
jgi:hypothetical protein